MSQPFETDRFGDLVMVNVTAGRVLLEVRGATKRFDGVPVLQNVDLVLRSGELHALLGANGSGKSTLIKIISGYHQASGGDVQRNADPESGEEPVLACVHQDLGLVDSMNVVENIAISCGYVTSRSRRIQWSKNRVIIEDLLEQFNLSVPLNVPVGILGGTARRLVAIARASHALGGKPGVLVLDEPTAALPPEEVHRVLTLARRVAEQGSAVLMVTHNLREALSAANRVTVLRDGKVVAQLDSARSNVHALARFMFGEQESDELARPMRAEQVGPGGTLARKPALKLSAVRSKRLVDVTIEVRQGEVLGATGLVGCGKSELARVVAGAQQMYSGMIQVGLGAPTTFSDPSEAVAAGIAFVPPDRRRSGGILSMDARENVTLNTLKEFFLGGRLRKRREMDTVRNEIARIGVLPANPRLLFSSFSGGNQQKLVLARVMRMKPRVVVLDEPTQGVDASTIPELYRFVRELAASGCGVLLVSSDLEEIVALADRALILTDGRVTGEVFGRHMTVEELALAIAAAQEMETV